MCLFLTHVETLFLSINKKNVINSSVKIAFRLLLWILTAFVLQVCVCVGVCERENENEKVRLGRVTAL